jgi:hypothetical protein
LRTELVEYEKQSRIFAHGALEQRTTLGAFLVVVVLEEHETGADLERRTEIELHPRGAPGLGAFTVVEHEVAACLGGLLQ